MSDPGKTTPNAFAVVVNDQGQHALWPAGLELPAGWRRQSAALPRPAGLDAIAGTWQDIAPASVHAGESGQRFPAGSAPGDPTRAGQRRHPVPHSRAARFAHELFAEQASRRPGSAAVIAEGTPLTYRELDQSANRLAHYLRELGAGPETLIGVYLERGVEAVRSLLAIMKAGCGYLPLDPSLPANRLARICEEARPMAILAGGAGPAHRGGRARETPGEVLRNRDQAARDQRPHRRSGPPAGHGARGQPAPGQHGLRDPHLGIHRPGQGGRRQPWQPGLRHQRNIPRVPDHRHRPGDPARLPGL